jgi:hypothetical protein
MLYFGIHFQGRARKSKAAITVEMEASENPTLDSVHSDPTLFCTAFKKNRFYMFTRYIYLFDFFRPVFILMVRVSRAARHSTVNIT